MNCVDGTACNGLGQDHAGNSARLGSDQVTASCSGLGCSTPLVVLFFSRSASPSHSTGTIGKMKSM